VGGGENHGTLYCRGNDGAIQMEFGIKKGSGDYQKKKRRNYFMIVRGGEGKRD